MSSTSFVSSVLEVDRCGTGIDCEGDRMRKRVDGKETSIATRVGIPTVSSSNPTSLEMTTLLVVGFHIR